MKFIKEQLSVVRANRHDRRHLYDNTSKIPKEIFTRVVTPDKAGIYRQKTYTKMSDEAREAVKKDITQRVQSNVSLLPERLQSRTGEVAEAITAFVAHKNYLAGEVGFLSATDSSIFKDDDVKKRQCAHLMRETGLIEVFLGMTKGGIVHSEHWRLSKKIDPVLQKND